MKACDIVGDIPNPLPAQRSYQMCDFYRNIADRIDQAPRQKICLEPAPQTQVFLPFFFSAPEHDMF